MRHPVSEPYGVGESIELLPLTMIDGRVVPDAWGSLSGVAFMSEALEVAVMAGVPCHTAVINNGATMELIVQVPENASGYHFVAEQVSGQDLSNGKSGVQSIAGCTFDIATGASSTGPWTIDDSQASFPDTGLDASFVQDRVRIVTSDAVGSGNRWLRCRIANASGGSRTFESIAIYHGATPVICTVSASILAYMGKMRGLTEVMQRRYGVTMIWCNRGEGGRSAEQVDTALASTLTERNWDLVIAHAGGGNISTLRPEATANPANVASMVAALEGIVSKCDVAGVPLILCEVTYREYLSAPLTNDGANQENGSLPFNIHHIHPVRATAHPQSVNFDLYNFTFTNRATILNAPPGDGIHPEDAPRLLRWFGDKVAAACGLSRIDTATVTARFDVGSGAGDAAWAQLSASIPDAAGSAVASGVHVMRSFTDGGGSQPTGGRTDVTGVPAGVSVSYHFINDTATGRYFIDGFDPDKQVTMNILGSRDAAGTRDTIFDVDGVNITIETGGKTNMEELLVYPNNRGRIDLDVTEAAASGAQFGYFNALEIHQ